MSVPGLSRIPSDPDHQMGKYDDASTAEGESRLRDDIRLLGRILGDTVRDQEGENVFVVVETIRQTSIRFHRDDDRSARGELESLLNGLTTAETVRIVRAFSYFSHLANIAEDRNNIRQMRAARSDGAGGLEAAIKSAIDHGVDAERLRDFFANALISPVLTAHPTEVRRRSTIDREIEIAALSRGLEVVGAAERRKRGERRATPPRRFDVMADQFAAAKQAHGPRRGQQRPILLRHHVPARSTAAALRA